MSQASRISALVSLSKLVTAQPSSIGALHTLQMRLASTDLAASKNTNKHDEIEEYTYTGPFSVAVRRVKKLSLFSLLCAVSAGPVIFALDGGATFTAKASIATTLCGFGAFTTGLLHWFTSPYVHRLHYDPTKETVEVDVLTFLAKPKTNRFKLEDAKPANTMHPLASFSAGNSYYHVDAEYFKNKRLLQQLLQQQEEQQQLPNESGATDAHQQ